MEADGSVSDQGSPARSSAASAGSWTRSCCRRICSGTRSKTSSRLPDDPTDPRGLMKVGWAFEPTSRAAGLSELPALGLTGERWELLQQKSWADQFGANRMERILIEKILRSGRKMDGEYVRISGRNDLVRTTFWTEAMYEAQEELDREASQGAHSRTSAGSFRRSAMPSGLSPPVVPRRSGCGPPSSPGRAPRRLARRPFPAVRPSATTPRRTKPSPWTGWRRCGW